MTPASRYAELELVMLNNSVPDAEIEPIVDEMDDCWRRMSDEERHDADARAKAWAVKTKQVTPAEAEAQALGRRCPHCGAMPGQWCRDFRGGLSVRIHKKRARVALEAAPVTP